MTMLPFRGRCHTCGHDHDAQSNVDLALLKRISSREVCREVGGDVSLCSPMWDRISDLEAAAVAYAAQLPTPQAAEALNTARRNVYNAVAAHIAQQLADPHRRRLAALVLELAEAVDNAHDDIGGSRPQLTILREAVEEARRVRGGNVMGLKTGPMPRLGPSDEETKLRGAVGACLSVLVRMIPEACEEHGLEQCTDEEHNRAIAEAAEALYGRDRTKWPNVLIAVAEGRYE